MNKRIIILGIIFCLMLAGVGFAQQDRSAEAKSLMASLDSPGSAQRIIAAKNISRSGLTDIGLYTKVSSLLKQGYMQSTEKGHIDEMAWLCKA